MLNSWIIALIILIIGAVIFLILRKANVHYYVLILVVFLTLGLVAYAFNDTITQPKEITGKDGKVTTGCEDPFVYRPEYGDCYNASPFGHTIVSLFAMLSAVFALSYVAELTIKAWRMYLTPKMLYYKNRYLKENKPINKHIDTYRAGNVTWSYKGYGAIMASKDNEIHVARCDSVSQISNLTLLKGAAQKVSSEMLFDYIGRDEKVFRQIMAEYSYNPKNHKLSESITDPPEIYIPIPLTNGENKQYYSLKNNLGFGANRFKYVITEMFKMRRAISVLKNDMTATSNSTLSTAVMITDKGAVIGSGVSRLRQEEVVKDRTPQYVPEYQNQNNRQTM